MDHRPDVDRQGARITGWATGQHFSVDRVEAALAGSGGRLVVVDPAEVDEDLVGDVTEILSLLCARLYGRRVAADRAARVVAVATVVGSR